MVDSHFPRNFFNYPSLQNAKKCNQKSKNTYELKQRVLSFTGFWNLMYLLSTLIIFYSGAWSFWLEFNFDDSFISLAWIPVFALGVLLNIHFAKFNNKKLKNDRRKRM